MKLITNDDYDGDNDASGDGGDVGGGGGSIGFADDFVFYFFY